MQPLSYQSSQHMNIPNYNINNKQDNMYIQNNNVSYHGPNKHLIHPLDPKVMLPSLSETFPEYFTTNPFHISEKNSSITPSPDSKVYLQKLPVFHPNFNTTQKTPQLNRFDSSYIGINGADRKPRPRRRYEEVERLYHCIYPGCNKAYGALNHLNSHIVSKGHGKKRSPQEFQELRRALKMRNESQALQAQVMHQAGGYYIDQYSHQFIQKNHPYYQI